MIYSFCIAHDNIVSDMYKSQYDLNQSLAIKSCTIYFARMISKSTPLNKQLCFALYSANNAMGRLYRPILGELGLTYPQYLVLLALWENDGCKVGDLGAALGLETNTLTPLLKRMQAAGFVSRVRDPQDERSVVVTLTDMARDMEAKAVEIEICVAQAAGQDFEELAQLREQINKLTIRLRAGF